MSESDDPLLRAVELSKSFDEVDVLEDLSFTVSSGESVALLGPNGVGKTTLIRLCAGLTEPSGGGVELEGRSVASWSRRDVAARVALLEQAAPRVFDFTALELVLMGFHARTSRFALPSEEHRARAREAMRRLEIEELAPRPASVLSGGELQRTLMARMLVADAALWLLDEPTNHLDVRHRVALLECVEEHVDGGGAAVAAMHDLDLASRFFDRVLLLDEGRLVADGPMESTLTEELASRVYGVCLRRGEVAGRTVWVAGGD
ncbi:MAG: ABC transporter ATP-binding protein [Bradymonadaceae bacterium]